ncbi:MAG: PASTA domain-containing protein [Candidatus Babeliaceae bacterium]|nr:PASTA domain-containing protein [Candidatus Babeliaceae bacterium]
MRWHQFVLLFVPFVSFLGGYWFVALLVKSESFETPNVIGMSLSEAVMQLSAKQLNVRILAERDEAMTPGIVLDQVPRSGQKIKTHQPVFVLISRQHQKIGAPALCGLSRKVAENRAQVLKIRLKVREIDHAAPAQTVVAQIPAAGSELGVPPHMILYVSLGMSSGWHVMPSLIEQPIRIAERWLAQQGVRTVCDEEVSNHEGVVVAQQPLPGSLIESGKPMTAYLTVG